MMTVKEVSRLTDEEGAPGKSDPVRPWNTTDRSEKYGF